MEFPYLSPNGFVIGSGIALLLQAIGSVGPNTDVSSIVSQAGQLTLSGALIIGLRAQWLENKDQRKEHVRLMADKDAIIIAMATKTTETMVLVMAGVAELRKSTEQSGSAMDNLADNVAALSYKVDGGKITER